MSRSTRLSLIRRANRDIDTSWLTRLKNFSKSISTTQRRPLRTYSRAFEYRLLCAPLRTKAVARLRKVWFKEWAQDLMQRLLNQSIYHRRDAQHPHPWPPGFGISTFSTGCG